MLALRGSSPLARGLRDQSSQECPARWIIPARAGFTAGLLLGADGVGDHPRSRGVYAAMGSRPREAPGSSPLARGLPATARHPRRG